MLFDQLLSQVDTANEKTALQFPSNWCQGRTAFGGLSAALLLQAAKKKLTDNFRLLSMSTNFVGPLLAEQDFTIEIEVLRLGKNSCQILAKAIQNEQVCVIAQLCFAKNRASNLAVNNSDIISLGKPNKDHVIGHQTGITPEFFQHIDLNPQQGAMPFSGATSHNLGGWMKFKHAPAHLSPSHILALTDSWPPTMLQMFKMPAPASSMSWYIEFLVEPKLNNDAWIGFEAITHHSSDGYAIEDAKIWSEDGQLLALSRQTVAIFA
ncbi:thioesterase family protein [Pseudoalteromonas tunicata]|jgi:acyl-CoA thioesterase|uniref:Putative acyl-CoA thioesterase, TesB family protein n=1 Tax=Pseudoalteromonas tunicata D2 TaxID=87626 RepID=A4C4J7_9GAMM|nr:thioesterase family protein [Pseudoalteromonas tunicata]ATC97040.1 hypothetical protein PTUN_b0696 [Pseudoalteromonas tunicata]AXT33159.1 thioesterase family protein [Pseudoalteromonas tunicata]EAR30479.1 putative acyl-CoA thioesterase, TesB family protein [Pseudoalteromonas tunicata D2]MDP4985178.1 thioesterase family protein [Pseudoalteromonas tunicata]MDP5213838.1 thioesterase family protein [Pseudoalteromonas tunicata]